MQGADNPFAIPLSAVVGIPLYIRAEAVIPLASVLMTKGMGLGALMALIIGSAGASLTEVILLKSMFRIPMIVAFLTVILGMAILIAKWHLNRSQFGIRIDHDLASISDHSLASQSITIWHASDH